MNISNFIAQRYFFLNKKHKIKIFIFLILCPLIFIAEFHFLELVETNEVWQNINAYIPLNLQIIGIFILPAAFTFFFLKNAFRDLKLNLVNILSGITILLVAVGAMSLVIVLSVFNGLEVHIPVVFWCCPRAYLIVYRALCKFTHIYRWSRHFKYIFLRLHSTH